MPMTPVTDQRANNHEEVAPAAGRRVTVGRVAAVTVCLAIFAMWVYVFTAADDYHPAGWLKDRRFPNAAEAACKPFAARLAEIPPASSARTTAERADLVDQATEVLAGMQAALRPLVPEGKQGRHIGEWVQDWSTHIGDRNRFAAKVRTDPDAEFIESPKQNSQLSSALNRFAQVNEMPSCVTAKDV